MFLNEWLVAGGGGGNGSSSKERRRGRAGRRGVGSEREEMLARVLKEALERGRWLIGTRHPALAGPLARPNAQPLLALLRPHHNAIARGCFLAAQPVARCRGTKSLSRALAVCLPTIRANAYAEHLLLHPGSVHRTAREGKRTSTRTPHHHHFKC